MHTLKMRIVTLTELLYHYLNKIQNTDYCTQED
jgi:hypothetical protein